MLSQHDRRALAGIEAALRASDPDLARRLEGPPGSAPPREDRARRRRISPARLALALGLALGLGLILLAAAFTTHNADVAVSAVTVLVVVCAGAALSTVSRFGHRSR